MSTPSASASHASSASPIVQVQPLGFPWPTLDPFLFCAYHDDAYPRATARMGPDAPVQGRQIGADFSRQDGWSLYHGHPVPGFPGHPHRGFETVTVVRRGLVDHADSLGAAARYGEGDVQWLTAGAGIQHAEMFPLLRQDADNPLELFQIWLNLPARRKMVAPRFTMFWADQVPQWQGADAHGRRTQVRVVAGWLAPAEGVRGDADAVQPLAPPPDSWAAQADTDVAIWTLRMEAGAEWTLPAAAAGGGTRRMLYLFRGEALRVGHETVRAPAAIELRAGQAVALAAIGEAPVELLLLQGRPIGEPVAQYGPFVMNTQAEIMQAMQDYRRTGFGGWPWPEEAPVHGRDPRRFARHPDGREERPPTP